jgi:hypothetical protein
MVEELPSDHQPILFPSLYENDEEMLQSRTVREIQIASNFAVLKSSSKNRSSEDDDNDTTNPTSSKRCKKEVRNNEIDPKQYQLAIETAILVQKEIEQWEKSISELEQMLYRQEGKQSQSSSPLTDSSTTTAMEDTFNDKNEVIGTVVEKKMNVPIAIPRMISASNETRVVLIDNNE